ncbi:hypothetical protein MTBBW1_2130088 [Desulfamplus magnetovallimortis]|uniref:Uncharacterized protein n=1 Tax=Desulfamplus magnetovallimortis TaxID=1246637 RepID=A0A1W1HCM7_9BACT|nr:hypothetical protein [Desulfamplus magnetovallimortis]SLM30193.1 hypothetical protein MTBBW1_2130088 [Desulfamplus magnetovallimortis]
MIPKFDCYHAALHSSYISFDKYIKHLNRISFSGYAHLYSQDLQFFYFIKPDKKMPCLSFQDGRAVAVNPDNIVNRFSSSFSISTYRCPASYADYFSRIHTSDIINKNIAIDASTLAGLLGQFETKKITGFLEALKTGAKKTYIYFFNGKILGYLNVRHQDGFFEKNLDRSDVHKALNGTTVNIYSFSSSSAATEKSESADLPGLNNVNEASLKHVDASSPGVAEKPSSKFSEASSPKNEASSSVKKKDVGRRDVISCYEKILQMLEKEIGSIEFDSIWRNCAMELSAEFDFLNPFAGEFNYLDARVDLWEKVDTSVAANALDALVNLIAKRANLPKDGIKSIKNNFTDILVAYEVRN